MQCNSLIYDSNYLCSAAASFSFLCNISLTVVVNSHQMTVALLRRESRNLSVIYVSPTQIARVRGLKNLIKRLHTPLRLLTQCVFLSAYIGMEMDLNINTAERRRAGISSYAAPPPAMTIPSFCPPFIRALMQLPPAVKRSRGP